MAGNIIIDTGVIVALSDRRDHYHRWCKKQSGHLSYPFYTCEAVLSESFHLLEPVGNGTQTLLGFLKKELIQVSFSYPDQSEHIHRIISKYDDLPAGFADACLVCMHDVARNSRIFTLDNDFTIYRNQSGNPLSLISPNAYQ
jgi:predicted nucleic acid-binding protein